MADRPLPVGYSLDSLLTEWPDGSIANFEKTIVRLSRCDSPSECTRLNEWIDRQQVCTIIAKHHGTEGVARVIKAIAEASARHQVGMAPRVQSVADFYGIGS